MTGQVVAAIILALGVATCGWFVWREAKQEKARRETARLLLEFGQACDEAAKAIGAGLIPVMAALARSVNSMAEYHKRVTS